MSETIRVRNFGGMHQLVIQDAADLARIHLLDPARWAATSAPVRDLHCDAGLLQCLDPKGTGRIRVEDLTAARDWAFARLANRSRLADRTDVVRLADLNTSSPEGQRLRTAAGHILSQLGASDREEISLGQIRQFQESYKKTLTNGDGVVPAALVDDPAVAELIGDILATVGGRDDASGHKGVAESDLEAFLQGAAAYVAWDAQRDSVRAWGADSDAALAAVQALDAKIEAWFWVSDLLLQQGSGPAGLVLPEADRAQLQAAGQAAIAAWLADAPLAPANPSGALPLEADINPAHASALAHLRTTVLERHFGPIQQLTRTQWQAVKAVLAPLAAWQAAEPAGGWAALGAAKLARWQDSVAVAELRTLMASDAAAKVEVDEASQWAQLALYQRWLVEFANNFVNFSAIYNPDQQALIDAGFLVMDGRRLEFCVEVASRADHKKVAAESLLFLAYCQVTDKDGGAVIKDVVAPVTSGERGRIRVGKRGLYVDPAGKQWDATVVDLVENPISIAEAIKAPFRRASDFVSKKIEDMMAGQLADAEKSATASLDKGVNTAASAAKGAGDAAVAGAGAKAAEPVGAKPAAPAPEPAKKPDAPAGPGGMQNMLLGGGIAFAALGSSLAYVVSALSSVKPLSALLAILSIVTVIVAVSALLGWLKLRRRDMSLLLEASGWAVNVHMKVTRPIGRFFTRIPALPEGAVRENLDLLALRTDRDEKGSEDRSWIWLLLALIGLLALLGTLKGLGKL